MELKQEIEQFKGQPRLPTFAIPKHYDVHLNLNLSASTFSGSVQIALGVVEPTRFLVLNASQLVVQHVLFTDSLGRELSPYGVVLEKDDEILVLVFDEVISSGEGVLRIQFCGPLNEHLTGLYRCTYLDEGAKKNMATTQFQPVGARLCFPCWDEPAFKATFKIKLDVPSKLIALSNMPVVDEKVNGDVKTVYFEESPLMSTYVVAFVVGVYDYIEEIADGGVKVRVYCPPSKIDEGKFALDLAVKSLDIFTKYFSMPYPLPKLDMVSVPEFSAGAMENFGLIIYRENLLLHNDLLSTAAKKQDLAITVTHEVAHMWFGNLVTMEWWAHLWLNESFATWISYMATDILFPEWNIWTQFLQEVNAGLRQDAQEQSHPIEVEVQHASAAIETFDAISYCKGSALIRMLQDHLGSEVFQKSLSSYMKNYAWKNAKTEELWAILSEESGVDVSSLMYSWSKQKGYPLISAKFKDHILELDQSHFLSSGLQCSGKWIVPISFALGSYDRTKKFVMEQEFQRVNTSELFPSNLNSVKETNQGEYGITPWVKVNVDQSGFYRVKYGDELAIPLRNAILNDCLSASDKYGILDDAYALCEACKHPLSSLLPLMNVYRKELDYIVLSKLIEVCHNVLKIARDAIPDSVNELKEFFINILLFPAELLGWELVPGESHLNTLLRGELSAALVTFGHQKTGREAMQRFQAFLEDKSTSFLPPDTRRAAYIAIMRNDDARSRDGFDSLLKIYKEVDSVQEQERVYVRYNFISSLASSRNPDVVLEALNLLLTDELRDQDATDVVAGISLEGRETAWMWFKVNWDLIIKKYGAGIIVRRFINRIVTPFCSDEKGDEVEEFFSTRMNPSFAKTVERCIEQVRIKARWVESIKQEPSLLEVLNQLA